MRTEFIINPKAGKNQAGLSLIPTIREHMEKAGGTAKIHLTDYPLHAQQLAREAASKGDPVRIYVAGGDGTLGEALNGIVGYENASLGVLPCGSGNDYLRTFGTQEQFLDIGAQLHGREVPVDIIRCGDRYALNLCCMGLDAKVADLMVRYKHLPLVSGSMSYHLALIQAFLGRMGLQLDVSIDGEPTLSGRFLFALAGCGQYYGGGYQGAPEAIPNDGLLDIVAVRPVPRYKIPFIIQDYKNGNHEALSDILTSYRGRSMAVRAKKTIPLSIDGEILHVQNAAFELIPGAVRFIVPAGVEPSWLSQPMDRNSPERKM